MPLVVDASVLVTLLAGAERAAQAQAALGGRHRRSLWAPHLLDAEVGHSLRRRAAAAQLGPSAALAALDDLVRLPLRRVPHRDLIPRAWELRENLSFYDALYVALAERLEATLVTFDARLARAAAGHVEVLVPGRTEP